MDMKYMEILQLNRFNIKYLQVVFSIIDFFYKGGISMLKFLAKTAEKYAKMTNTACAILVVFHQPKMPACMIIKD